ncbi:MAG: hypothetical protein ACR2P2_04575 [Nakamurella sp.]
MTTTQPSHDDGGTQAQRLVDGRADELFDEAQSILGDRLAEPRRDPDRAVRITVIDLNDDDIVALHGAATRLGIDDWLRLERADPAALEVWERLRHDLIGLQEAQPAVLWGYPTPDPGYRRPPVGIHLNAGAEATAADLHARYGGFISLTVGALSFPRNPEQTQRPLSAIDVERDLVDPKEILVELDGPLMTRSGETETHALLLTNTSDHEISVKTNGNVTAGIVDAETGRTVGGFSGPQNLPLIIFTAGPGQTVRIPLLVGTASYEPGLGYAVPAGTWQLTAPLDFADGRNLVTGPLPFTITG